MKLVSKKLAELAKEYGFDYKTFNAFKYQGFKRDVLTEISSVVKFNYNKQDGYTSRPYKSQLVDWFREEKNIMINIHPNNNAGSAWRFNIMNIILDDNNDLCYDSEDDYLDFGSYDRALNIALKESFKYIENEKYNWTE